MDLKNYVIERLPDRFQESVRSFSRFKDWTELRLRADAPLSAAAPDGNFFLGTHGLLRPGERAPLMTARDLTETLSALCGGAGYRYFDTLSCGFVTLDCGIRLGVAGEKRGDGSHLPEMLTGMNVRLPGLIENAADAYLSAVRNEALSSSLILSPPGGGKTTFLRALAVRLARGFLGRAPLRVAVADERRELFPAVFSRGNCDVLSGIPKSEGIRRAVTLFSPQVLICDEIGLQEDLRAIEEAGTSGVLFYASCHAADEAEIMAKPHFRALLEKGIFRRLILLSPVPGPHMNVSCRIRDVC